MVNVAASADLPAAGLPGKDLAAEVVSAAGLPVVDLPAKDLVAEVVSAADLPVALEVLAVLLAAAAVVLAAAAVGLAAAEVASTRVLSLVDSMPTATGCSIRMSNRALRSSSFSGFSRATGASGQGNRSP